MGGNVNVVAETKLSSQAWWGLTYKTVCVHKHGSVCTFRYICTCFQSHLPCLAHKSFRLLKLDRHVSLFILLLPFFTSDTLSAVCASVCGCLLVTIVVEFIFISQKRLAAAIATIDADMFYRFPVDRNKRHVTPAKLTKLQTKAKHNMFTTLTVTTINKARVLNSIGGTDSNVERCVDAVGG